VSRFHELKSNKNGLDAASIIGKRKLILFKKLCNQTYILLENKKHSFLCVWKQTKMIYWKFKLKFTSKYTPNLRISNKYGIVTTLKQWPNQTWRRGSQSCLANHWSEFFLKSNINFIIHIFYQTEFKQISKRQFENGSDTYFA
jgi:hypothetical protein